MRLGRCVEGPIEVKGHFSKVLCNNVKTVLYTVKLENFAGQTFRGFRRFVPACKNLNPRNYIYTIDNGNWIGIRENKIAKT